MKAARLTCGEEAGSKSGRERRETARSERQVWEKELETGQRDRSGRRNWRQVRVPAALQHSSGDRARARQNNSGDRVYFNTTAVKECTLTQQR